MYPQTCIEFGANRSICLAVFPDLNLWPPKTPRNAPCGIEGRILFPDESVDMYEIWCQSVEQFDSFTRYLNLWPPKTPQNAPWGIVGDLHLAYVHSQMNPQTWTKFDANRSSRLTASQDFWMFDPLKLPSAPCVSKGNLFGVYPFPEESAHVCQIWCQSVQPFDSFNILLNLWPP